MQQQRFGELARGVFSEGSLLRNIAAAPELVVAMVYPLKGNEKAIGLDYRANDKQRSSVMRAVASGEMVLAGPVDLVQGGRGLIGRFPVMTASDDGNRFWGVVSAVIDVDRLYRDSGLSSPTLDIDVAIVGRDGRGRDGAHFFGDPAIFDNSPVEMSVSLPGGSWRMTVTTPVTLMLLGQATLYRDRFENRPGVPRKSRPSGSKIEE